MRDACVLDTHAWIALMQGSDQLPARARRFLQRGVTMYVPDTCLREVALLWGSGRVSALDVDMPPERWLRLGLADPCELMPMSPEIAVCSVELGREGFHRDPSDRVIYATARVLGLPLLTRDDAIHRFEKGLPRTTKRLAVWD